MFGKKRLNENEEYEFDQVYEKDYEGEFAEIPAEDVELLSSRNEGEAGACAAPAAAPSADTPAAGFTAAETDELPF